MSDIKNAVIFVFSGTGNTYKAARLFAAEFERQKITTDIVEIKKSTDNISVESYDFIGIAYPIHAFNAPSIVVDFADKLPETGNKKVFIVKTSGEPLEINNISSMKLTRKLKRKGYIVTNEYHYAMPYNMIFRHNDNMAYKMYETLKALAPIEAREVIKGVPHQLKKVPFGGLVAYAFRIEQIAMKINGRFFRVNYDKCIMCGKCVRNCPTDNIKIVGGKFKFGGDCVCCVKCSFSCPADAINIALLNNWKVNGAYDMTNADARDDGSHSRFCRKAYKKYFENAAKKTAENKLDNL